MRTLLTRGLVEEAGQDESSGATLFRTTSYFLERIGVTGIEELPELAPYLPDLADMEDMDGMEAALGGQTAPTPEEGPSTEPDGGTEPT
jgi:segregation and condensation protein B